MNRTPTRGTATPSGLDPSIVENLMSGSPLTERPLHKDRTSGLQRGKNADSAPAVRYLKASVC
jgi:hypothetical protein